MEPIKVESYAGYRGTERPLVFVLRGERHVVKDILSYWCEENAKGSLSKRCFQVLTEEGKTLVLSYIESADEWLTEESC